VRIQGSNRLAFDEAMRQIWSRNKRPFEIAHWPSPSAPDSLGRVNYVIPQGWIGELRQKGFSIEELG
jgi:hypothetical protein